MRLSNKSTFSLACLILLMAFVALPVMAHDGVHPLNENIPNDPATDGVDEAVSAHTGHPVPTISVKPGATVKMINGRTEVMVAVAVDDDTTPDINEDIVSRQFTLVIDFNQPVASTDDVRSVPNDATATVPVLGFSELILDAVGINGINPSKGTLTRINASQLELVLTVQVNNLPDADAADAATPDDDEYTYRVRVNAGADNNGAFSLAAIPAGAFGEVPGGLHLQSNTINLVLVKALTPDPVPVVVDKMKPTVTIISTPANGAELPATGVVMFTISVGTDDYTGADADGVVSFGEITVENGTKTDYDGSILTVTPTDATQPVKVIVAEGAVVDKVGNMNIATPSTWLPKGYKAPTPTVTISGGNSAAAGKIAFTIDFSHAVTGFDVSDIEVSNAALLKIANLSAAVTASLPDGVAVRHILTVTPTDAAQPVTVTIRAGAVMAGDLAVDSGQVSYTLQTSGTTPITPTTPTTTPGGTDPTDANYSGVISVPGGGTDSTSGAFVVVVRDKDAANARGLAFRSDVNVIEWAGMPDLRTLFDRGAPGGGGAIVVQTSTTQPSDKAIAVGTVGISEIMWGIDLGVLGNEAAEITSQWIELHNLNKHEAKVLLYHKTGTAIKGDGNITGNLVSPTIDAVTNFFNNRPGNTAWDVPGSNGNTKTGANFVSMARVVPGDSFDLERTHKDKLNSRFTNKDGRASGNWQASTTNYILASTANTNVVYYYIGTPGRVNSFKPATQGDLTKGRTSVPSDKVIINEVGNRSNDSYDWIELRNTSGSDGFNLRNYAISIVTSNSSDVRLIQFPANDNAKIAKDGVFLILASDPASDDDHPLTTGYNVDKKDAEQAPGKRTSPVRYKVVDFSLPDDGKFILIVRRPDNHENKNNDGGKGPAELGKDDIDKIVDVAGWDDDVGKTGYPNSVSNTGVWPLHNFAGPSTNRNAFYEEKVHRRQYVTTNDGRVGVGAHENKNQDDRAAFRDVGWTGVGYRQQAAVSSANGGTPGYSNGALSSKGSDVTSSVYISEIMYADASGGTLPQWIELRNTSKTAGANLHNWRLTIVNHDSTDAAGGLWDGKGEANVLLRDLKIKPNSSVLITSRKGPRSEVYLSNSDIFVFYPARRDTFGMKVPGDDVINSYGFRILLQANAHDTSKKKDWQFVDEVGNLAIPMDDRRGNRERFDDVRWSWPDANDEDGDRISVARIGNKAGVLDGTMPQAWVLSSKDKRTDAIDFVYYGHKNDTSTPGQTFRSPLPVSLSYFRPTLENGEVVIHWTTESELDNAGFNILRSDSRNGEFKQVNSELVQGAGTTGERNTYKWVDESAKPRCCILLSN